MFISFCTVTGFSLRILLLDDLPVGWRLLENKIKQNGSWLKKTVYHRESHRKVSEHSWCISESLVTPRIHKMAI